MTPDELKQTVFLFTDQIFLINSNRLIYKRLTELCAKGKKYSVVVDMSPVFWNFMTYNMGRQILLGLAKLYDESKDALGLKKLINICDQNRSLFQQDKQASISDEACACTIDQFYAKRFDFRETFGWVNELYDRTTPIREKIKTLRDKDLVHADKKHFYDTPQLYLDFPVPWGEVETLLENALDICNALLELLQPGCTVILTDTLEDIDTLIKHAFWGNEYRMNSRKQINLSFK